MQDMGRVNVPSVIACNAATSSCEKAQTYLQALLLLRRVQFRAIELDAITDRAAITAGDMGQRHQQPHTFMSGVAPCHPTKLLQRGQ